eukprot:gene20154-20704_t
MEMPRQRSEIRHTGTWTRDPVGGAMHFEYPCGVCGAKDAPYGSNVRLREAIAKKDPTLAGTERPWMKFYPRDWRGDQALRVVSLAARGVWMECLCIMHEAKPYGHLLINGKPIGDDALARMVGAPADQVSAYMAELREAGVLSVTRNGVVFSRRMIKDDAAARKGAKAVAKRWEQASANKGKPKSPNREPIQEPITHIPEAREQKKEETDKSVSSPQAAFALSEPPSGKPRSTGQPGSRFPEFWAAYPKRSGNNSRKDAAARFDRIVKSGADPGMIIDGARRYAIWCDATGKTRTEFIQQAPTWLNANGWENDYAVTPAEAKQSEIQDLLHRSLQLRSAQQEDGKLLMLRAELSTETRTQIDGAVNLLARTLSMRQTISGIDKAYERLSLKISRALTATQVEAERAMWREDLSNVGEIGVIPDEAMYHAARSWSATQKWFPDSAEFIAFCRSYMRPFQ